MLVIFYKVLVIFLMIAVGYGACKLKWVTFEANSHLINLLMTVLSPCMIFTAIAHNTLSDELMAATIEMMVCTGVYFVAGAVVLYLLFKLLKVDDPESGAMCFQLLAKNTGFMGFPVVTATFGPTYLYYMVLHNLIGNIYNFTGGFIQMLSGDPEAMKHGARKRSRKETLKLIFNNCTIAAIAGTVMLFAGLQIPALLDEVMSPIGDATIPVSMIVVGIQIADRDLLEIVKNRLTLTLAVLSLALVPAVVFLIVNWLPLFTEVKLMLVYAAALPTLVISVVIATLTGRDATRAAEFVSLTTFLSMATLPLWTMFLSYWYNVAV